MLTELKNLIRKKLQTKPQLNHTLIDTKQMKKTSKKMMMSEAKDKPMMKGKKMMDGKKSMSKMNKPTRKTKKG